MKTFLFLMLGYPGSGKSTFAKLIAAHTGAVRINSDELRTRMFATEQDMRNTKLNPYVFGVMDYMAEAALQSGHSVVYDTNNNRFTDRNKKSKTIADKHASKTIVVWVQTPLETAKQREKQRQAAGDQLSVPEERYEQIVRSLQPPLPSEKVIIIDGLQSAEVQLQSFKTQLSELQ